MKESKQEVYLFRIPEFSDKFFVTDVSQSVWHSLSEYENEAYTRKFIEQNYKLKKLGNRSYEKAASFFSFNIRQGIEYFRNSHNSSLAIKPLLLYYGIMSFAKAIIIYNDPGYLKKLENKDNRRHGLSYSSKCSKKFCMSSDTVRIKTPGTFDFFQNSLDIKPLTANTDYALRDLYSWMTGLSLVETDVYIPGKKYENYIDEIPVKTRKTMLCRVVKKNKNNKFEGEISIKTSLSVDDLIVENAKKDIKKIIPELADFRIVSCDPKCIILKGLKEKYNPRTLYGEFIATQQVLSRLNLISHYDGYNLYLFQRFGGREFVAQSIAYYLVSYILGSICRYEPIKWRETLEAKKTNEKWLAELAINEISNNFPLFVISYFRHKHTKFLQK
ncbi:MAG: hypothetical protein FJZ04_02930 [Candidatus Moranbacteria bacterium]|nr:hypothetical protein [Candidatus Moranbacteria bacterium]